MSTWAQIMAGSRVTITVRFSICLSSLFIYSIWSDILVSLHPFSLEIMRNYHIAKWSWGLKDATQGKRHSPGLFAVSQSLWELPLISPCQPASLMKTQNKIKVILRCSLLRDKNWHSRGGKVFDDSFYNQQELLLIKDILVIMEEKASDSRGWECSRVGHRGRKCMNIECQFSIRYSLGDNWRLHWTYNGQCK